MADTFDIVISGAGHNSLTTAAYLAKDGLELASAVRQGRVTAGALLDIAVERAEKLNPALVTRLATFGRVIMGMVPSSDIPVV